jgi:Na+/proline symporter
MFLLGPIYKSFSRTSSDFFRGGGGMLWWVVGSSAFMTTFTAWAFTAGAAKAYETGTSFLVIFACNIVALIFCYLFVVAKYRQMRIITVMEGVRRRLGKTSEQMLTWLLVVVKILYGGAMLYAIAIFMASVFNVPMPVMIIVLGTIITLMTVFGGSWSATAGDFVQMIVVVIITVIMGVLTLIKVGGVGAFLDQIPDRHLDWTLFDRLLLIAAATGLPLAVPLFLGIFFRRTPPWAGWSTMVAGFLPAAILGLLFKVDPFVQWLWRNPEMSTSDVIRMIWPATDLNAREIGDLKLAITTGVVAVICTGWFFLTMLFYRKDEKSYVDQVDEFFTDMATPVHAHELELGDHDNESRQSAVLGNLCLVYGAFILLLIFTPNEPSGRLIIFCCGAISAGIGLILKAPGERSRQIM